MNKNNEKKTNSPPAPLFKKRGVSLSMIFRFAGKFPSPFIGVSGLQERNF
jgi:hypothetical protein